MNKNQLELKLKEIEIMTDAHIKLSQAYLCVGLSGTTDQAKEVLDRLNEMLKVLFAVEEKGAQK